jgi:hypothetical protein
MMMMCNLSRIEMERRKLFSVFCMQSLLRRPQSTHVNKRRRWREIKEYQSHKMLDRLLLFLSLSSFSSECSFLLFFPARAAAQEQLISVHKSLSSASIMWSFIDFVVVGVIAFVIFVLFEQWTLLVKHAHIPGLFCLLFSRFLFVAV